MIGLLALLSAGVGTVPASARSDVRCAVALSYVKGVVENAQGRRMVFGTEERPPFDIVNGGWFEAGADLVHPKPLPPPPDELVEKLASSSQNAVRRCATVRQFLRREGIPYGPQAVKAARTRGVFKSYVQTVALPVVSADHRQAVLERGEMRGSMDGGGWFELLEPQLNGEWRVVAFRPTWMS